MNAVEFLEKGQDALKEARIITKSAKCNNIIMNGIAGIFIYQLPNDQIDAFTLWSWGQTITKFYDQPFAYASDYERWYDAWIKGEIAEVID